MMLPFRYQHGRWPNREELLTQICAFCGHIGGTKDNPIRNDWPNLTNAILHQGCAKEM
jgi:hypothetical protein